MRGLGLLVLWVGLAFAPARAFSEPASQAQDPYALLEASAQVMDQIQSERFSGQMDIRFTGTAISFSVAMTASGEFQAPDRVRLALDIGDLGGVELVVVEDQVWAREAGGTWKLAAEDGISVDPQWWARTHLEMASAVREPVLADLGSAYTVSGLLDSTYLESGMGLGQMGELVDPLGMELADLTGEVVFTIQKETLYMQHVEMSLTVPFQELEGSLSLEVSLAFSDFDSPSIQIEPPI